jgi:hypothetical protein
MEGNLQQKLQVYQYIFQLVMLQIILYTTQVLTLKIKLISFEKINFIVLIIIAYTFSSCALDTLADEEKYDVLNSKGKNSR